jgi:hypothetical protein
MVADPTPGKMPKDASLSEKNRETIFAVKIYLTTAPSQRQSFQIATLRPRLRQGPNIRSEFVNLLFNFPRIT